jgi:hypothetical protein
MENLTKKSDFRSAYEAGRQELQSRMRPFSLVRAIGLAVSLILALEVTKWLAARFHFSGFEKTLFDCLAYLIVFSVYLFWLWGMPTKRNKT